MSEIVRFQLARRVERREPHDSTILRLFDDPVDVDPLFPRPSPDVIGSRGLDEREQARQPQLERLRQDALAWQQEPTRFADPDRRATPVTSDVSPRPQPHARVIDLLRDLDRWLVRKHNLPTVDELIAQIAELAKPLDIRPDGRRVVQPLVGDSRWTAAWDSLRRSLCALLAAPPPGDPGEPAAAQLQRLLLIAGLVKALTGSYSPRTQQDVRSLLRDRTVLVPSPPFPLLDVREAAPRRRAKLVRRPGVADLWVIRDEWACYVPGEIAHIENVLHGERKEQVYTRTDETETTITTEKETTSVDQLDRQTTERFNVTDDATQDTSLAVHVDGQVDTSGQYGPTKVETHIGGSIDWSTDDSHRHATEHGQETVERAVHRVEERVLARRVQRTLTRVEDKNSHLLDNSTDPTGNVVGIYRWVDKIQRLQLFRYPNRYLLEFEIPEPASFIRWLTDHDTGPSTVTPPAPYFTTDGQPEQVDGGNRLTAANITPDTYTKYVAIFRATNLIPPPDPVIYVSGAVAVEIEDPSKDKSEVQQLAAVPTAGKTTTELVVPDGYQAVCAKASFSGTPVHARWLDFPAPWKDDDGWDYRDGYHDVRADVLVAGERLALEAFPVPPTVRPAGDEKLPEYRDAWVSVHPEAIALSMKPTQKVAVGVTMSGTYRGTVSVALQCELLPSKQEAWQLATFTQLLDAYRAWQQQHDNEKAAIAVRAGIVIAGNSPTRNREVVADELKRQIIEMLLGDRFSGAPALEVHEPPKPELPPRVNLDQAQREGPYIQFFEQVLEWDKMTYILYPYYWADASAWPTLQPIEDGADADFARFLRSGSARVVVSVRPGFERVINHFLWFDGRPWGGGPAPAPDHPLYISVADEIRTLTRAPDEGEPGESWEVRLPTTLVWLDPDPALPKQNPTVRLTIPKPKARLCQPDTPS